MAVSLSVRSALGGLVNEAESKTARVQRRRRRVDRKAVCVEALEGRRLLSAGVLDTTFGVDGEVATSLLLGTDAAVQSDGKIVVAGGKIGHNGVNDLAIVRFNANGWLDGGFGSGGITVTPVVTGGTLDDSAGEGVAVLPNGKILVSAVAFPPGFDGSAGPWFVVVARYNANGSLDGTFGNSGEAVLPCNLADPGQIGVGRLAVLDDGTIVVNAAQQNMGPSPASPLLAVFSSSGKPDTVFDPKFENGVSLLPPGVQTYLVPKAIAALPGNQFIVAGVSTTGQGDEAFAVLNEKGQVTATSSSAFLGNLPTQPVLSAQANAVAAVSSGEFVVAGSAEAQSGDNVVSGFALSQYNANGSIDASFNGGTKTYGPGTTLTTINGGGSAAAVVVEPGGKILVAGTAPTAPQSDAQELVLIRYNPNGSLDTTFGSGGIVLTGDIPNPFVDQVLVQPSGKPLIEGFNFLIRYTGDTPATLTGTVFNDTNGNGVQNTGESGLAGVPVYADLNNIGVYHIGDPVTTTNSQGKYTLSGLIPGQYIIRQVIPKGYHQTAPHGGLGIHLSVLAGQTLIGKNVGDLV